MGEVKDMGREGKGIERKEKDERGSRKEMERMGWG